VPPLEQPKSPLLPAGVFTTTSKLPGAGIIEDVMLTVIVDLLITAVERVAPLKITTEEATNWPPVAVRTKLGGSFEKTIVAGEIELRVGLGRALPQSGFSALHPGNSRSATSDETTKAIRQYEGINSVSRNS